MVADDSVVVRGLISRWLAESGVEVVATVPNGLLAISALDRVEPDIVLLDLDMPELDGLATLPRLLEKRPGLSVVVVSTLTQRNADISLKCLSLGAVDYLPKPGSNREVTTSLGFRQELIAKVQELARPRRRAFAEPAAAPTPRLPTRSRALPVMPRCLLIGASTGGPKAIADVLAGLGAALRSVPTLIVQHMPPIFTKVFAEHLQGLTGLACHEAQDGEAPLSGHVYVAPGGRHMGLSRDRDQRILLRLDDGPPVNFCRPAVDVLFRDAAAAFGASALAVVLTGMGSDGLDGVKALAQTGAAVLAQDEATSVVWGMPGHVARSGLAHDVLPLDGIAPAIRAMLGGAR
jgi:two-component system chemotaxis response regulator CheB